MGTPASASTGTSVAPSSASARPYGPAPAAASASASASIEHPPPPIDGQPAWESFAATHHDDDNALSPRGRLVWLLVAAVVLVGVIAASTIAISRRSRTPAATIWFNGGQAPLANGIHDAPKLRWHTTLPGPSPELSSLVQDDQRVYVAVAASDESGSSVVAFDRRSGKQLWSQRDAGPRPGLQLVAGRLLVNAGNGSNAIAPFALDVASGQRLWTINGQWAFAPGDNRPLLVGRDQTLVMVDPVTGTDRWTTGLTAGVAFDTGLLLERSCTSLIAHEWSTGRQLWKAELTNGGCSNNQIAPPTEVTGGVVIVVDNDQLIGLDRTDGHRLWGGPLPSPVQNLRAVDDDLVIGTDQDSGFAVRVATGDIAVDGLRADIASDIFAIQSGRATTLVRVDGNAVHLVDRNTLADIGDARPVDSLEQPQGFGWTFALTADTTYQIGSSGSSSDDRSLEAYNLATGQRRWSVPLGAATSLVSVGHSIIASDGRELFVFS